jgi:hypothetical protein
VPSHGFVGLRHEVHICAIWAYAEVSSVLRALAVDFFFNCWCFEIHSGNRMWLEPGCVFSIQAQSFQLDAF